MNDSTLPVRQTHKLANDYLYQQGEASPQLYLVKAGIVCLESANDRGERCIIHLMGQGALVGHEAFLQQPRSFDARVCTDAVLEVISMPVTTDITLGDSMMRWANTAVARLLQDAVNFKVELHRAHAHEKVLLLLEQLKSLHPESADVFWIPSRSEMADILGINHVTASRVMAKLFRESALLRASHKNYARVDWERVRLLLRSA